MMLQQTPLAVTGEPPSVEITPPEPATSEEMPITARVVNAGTDVARVVKLTSLQ